MGPKIKELLLPLAVVVIHIGVCTAFELPFFGGDSNTSNVLNGSNSTGDPNSKLHLLIPHTHSIHSDEADKENMIHGSGTNITDVPPVEFEKLKSAAKTAGLSEPKADRLARAAQMMNMTFDEVAEARKLLSSPTTSADFADKVRQKLEQAAIEHKINGSQNQLYKDHSANILSPGSLNSTPMVTMETRDLGNATSANETIDPLALQKLAVSSALGGLKYNETQRLVRAIVQSNMNSTHVNNLVDAMTQHAPTPTDLNLLADHLELNGTSNSNATSKSNVTNTVDKKGNSSDWFSVPLPQDLENQRKARQESVDSYIFSATRNCGVSPKVDPSRLTNVSPGQYPWNAAILTSDDVFHCSGTLISESIVLTTASCILNYKKNKLALKIVLGAWSFPSDPTNSQPELAVYSKAAVLHPSYVEGSADVKNNIGLIRLYEEVNFDHYPHIFPLCIVGLSLIDPKALSNHCKVQGWPDLQNVDIKRARSYIAGGDVQTNTTGCTPANSCVTGTACVANEGSAVICPGSSLRYYQWGIVASQPRCARSTSTSLATVSIFDNYDFILNYLKAPNPNSA